MEKIKVGNRLIGEGEPCFIIAEAGSNHDGKLVQAKKLIDIAIDAGVDAIKFQTFSPLDIVHKNIRSNVYGYKTEKKFWYQILEDLVLKREWYPELFEYAKKNGIVFISTPSSLECAKFLLSIGVPAFKIASMDLTYNSFLRGISKLGKPIILSTGMGSLTEIEEAINNISSTGLDDIILMHCVSNYPALPKELNLLNIKTLKLAFGLPVGFSDHSLGITSSIVAVTLGACVIEKHITISRKLKGPDHSFSLEPNELKKLVKEVRIAEESLGSYRRIISKNEKEKQYLYRRSIIAKKSIKKGEIIRQNSLIISRPGNGLQPKFLDIIINTRAKRDIKAYKVLQWEDIL